MEEIKQQYNSTASTRTGPGLKGWEPLFKQKMIQTWEPAPRLFDAGWQDYLNKKEDKDPSWFSSLWYLLASSTGLTTTQLLWQYLACFSWLLLEVYLLSFLGGRVFHLCAVAGCAHVLKVPLSPTVQKKGTSATKVSPKSVSHLDPSEINPLRKPSFPPFFPVWKKTEWFSWANCDSWPMRSFHFRLDWIWRFKK